MSLRSENLLALPAGAELVADYQIQSVLGAGGFGITYLAREVPLDRSVTIKEYFPSDFATREASCLVRPKSNDCGDDYHWGLERFIEEAQTLAKFDHSNIIRVFRYFRANNTAYMVLQFEEGQSLKSWLSSLGRAPRQAELDAFLGPLLDALELIHSHDFLHRDIAPDNIIIRHDQMPVLIDFGSARGEMVQLSKTVSALVKPGYSPYEQYALTGRSQGPWTDIYSMGATLYQAISGRRPSDAPTRVVADDYRPAAEVALSSYRPAFLRAIDHALQLKVEQRPQSIAAWRGALFTDKPVPAARLQAQTREITKDSGVLAQAIGPTAAMPPVRTAAVMAPANDRGVSTRGKNGQVKIGLKGRLIALLEGVAQEPRARQAPSRPRSGRVGALPPPSRVVGGPERETNDRAIAAVALTPQPVAPSPIDLNAAASPARKPAARVSLEARKIAPRADQRRPSLERKKPPRSLATRVRRPVGSFLRKLAIGVCVTAVIVAFQDSIKGLLPAGLLTTSASVDLPGPPARSRASLPRRAAQSPQAGQTNAGQTMAGQTIDSGVRPGDPKPAVRLQETATPVAPAREPDIKLPERGEELTLRGHSGAVEGVVYTADGRFLVSLGADHTLRVWEAKGSLLRVIDMGSGSPAPHALAVFDNRAAVGQDDGTVSLWDLERGTKIKALKRNDSAISSVAFAGDQTRVVAGTSEGSVIMWDDHADAGPVHLFEGHESSVTALAYEPRGALIASAGADKSLKVWNAVTYGVSRTFRGRRDSVTAIAFSADGAYIASASGDRAIRIRPMGENGSTRSLRGHRGRIGAVGFAPDQILLASAADDGTARLWDWKRSRLVRTLAGHTGAVKSLAFSADGKRLATGGEDGTVRLWDATMPVRVSTKS